MNKFKILIIFLVVLTFTWNCGEKLPKHNIIKDESMSNIKRTVEVELENETTKEELEKLAQNIKSKENKSYERTFIGYRIKGQKKSSFWATTHFEPDLKVVIFALNKDSKSELENIEADIDGELIGTWVNDLVRGFECKVFGIKKGDKYLLKSVYKDGSENNEILVYKKNNEELILTKENDEYETGEYYKLNSKNELEFWGNNGKFYTAMPIK
ncbi:MAG: hypothetical protein KDK54_22165 [Leptospiraceae bacterium]|nr:hypothetical protein [Leptospiraceae bacterium]